MGKLRSGSIIEVNHTATETVHGSLRDLNRPAAGGAETDGVLVIHLAVHSIVNDINSIIEGIETRDAIVRDCHGGTGRDIFLSVDHLAVSGNHNAVDGWHSDIGQSLGRIDPCELGRKFVVRSRRNREVGRSLRRVVVNRRRHKVEDGAVARVVVDGIEVEPAVATATPTPIVVVEVGIIVAVANESVTTVRALTGIIQRPTHVERLFQFVGPVLVTEVVP